ncbi:alpha-L-glutamate ligase-related protein [Epsilonproteobacteria bacterium SCGC AD-308-P11]|nr:alpha-L-glutamate ligase-related protein [Epsilonproteobacteria bacterium SCGC AD-308-P11]SMP88110.1 alpha-L-glutamate ligase-related protein [Epsilonproteobacteria bacterium SCGC AD-308-O04]
MWFTSFFKLQQQGVVGMNYRNIELIGKYNVRSSYPLVDNKLITKKIAQEVGIAVTELYAKVESQSELKNLHDILLPYENFVIKPNHGSGGKGIIVITHRDGDHFIKASGDVLTLEDLRRHISNTLSGLYSLGGRYDIAIIEKLVVFDPMFKKYSYEGVPDIRIIVYRGYPVMAMMRCPTRSSDGKANLHQGAVGVGIDLKSGKATNAVVRDRPVLKHPDTGYDFSDLQIPHWEEILNIASLSYDMTGLGYLGADIVFDKNMGPLLLELNARPGLAIQIANDKGLKSRIKFVDEQKLTHTAKERVDFSMNNISLI